MKQPTFESSRKYLQNTFKNRSDLNYFLNRLSKFSKQNRKSSKARLQTDILENYTGIPSASRWVYDTIRYSRKRQQRLEELEAGYLENIIEDYRIAGVEPGYAKPVITKDNPKYGWLFPKFSPDYTRNSFMSDLSGQHIQYEISNINKYAGYSNIARQNELLKENYFNSFRSLENSEKFKKYVGRIRKLLNKLSVEQFVDMYLRYDFFNFLDQYQTTEPDEYFIELKRIINEYIKEEKTTGHQNMFE